ncbi:MAG: EutN/CcmL family microcompartment protein [Chloroflexaceae bacterium]|nr:EutN/CcmL family microcompartment protein [Chloroflexaceae bacterium]
MQIAIVRGTVVSTQKIPSLTGVKLLLVQFVNDRGESLGEYEVAADVVGAGIDEWVLVSRGSSARQESGYENRPVDALVVGIINTITVQQGLLYSKRNAERVY